MECGTGGNVVVLGVLAVASYRVAVGSPKHPTPRGSFAVRRIIWNRAGRLAQPISLRVQT